MRRILIIAATSVAALSTLAGPAYAQNNRSFVSGQGADANPCTLAAPCRSFAGALAQTNAGGEITVLDSAGYGVVTINKSITITNPGGVEAGATATGNQDAIQINAGSSSVNVTLRGLTLQGASGSSGSGIDWVSGGGNLTVFDCVTNGFGNNGIFINPASGSPFLKITISQTTVLNNGGGIVIGPQTGAAVNYSISHSIINGNGSGIGIPNLGGNALGSVSFVDSELNGGNGGLAFAPASGDLTVVNSVFKNNGMVDVVNGAGAGQTLYLYDANTIGHFIAGAGVITKTDGTNNVLTVSGGGSLTKVSPQ
jgi:hypothetical protein